MRHAGAEHAQLQLGRTRAEVVAREIGRAVADDLVLADAQAAHAAAAFGAHAGLELRGLCGAGRDGGVAGQHGGAFLGEVVVEVAHGVWFFQTVPSRPWGRKRIKRSNATP
ncbi:hypothetical protein D3C78_1604010 [compost metagenome]